MKKEFYAACYKAYESAKICYKIGCESGDVLSLTHARLSLMDKFYGINEVGKVMKQLSSDDFMSMLDFQSVLLDRLDKYAGGNES